MLERYYDRLCENCKNVRVPEIEHVKKGRKRWTIYTCRICKAKDIEETKPKLLWNGSFWSDELDNGESNTETGTD